MLSVWTTYLSKLILICDLLQEAFKLSRHEEELVNAARPYNRNWKSPKCCAAEKSMVGFLGIVKRKLKFGFKPDDMDEQFLFDAPFPRCPPPPIEMDGFHPLLFRDDYSNLLHIQPNRPTMVCTMDSIFTL